MNGSKISLTLGATRRAPPPPTNGVKRSRAALHEDEDEGPVYGRTETVSHFDRTAGGAIDADRKHEDRGPLIIPRMANRDWKEAASRRQRQKSGLPAGRGAAGDMEEKMAEVEAADAAKKPGFGLNLYGRERNGDDLVGEQRTGDAVGEDTEVAQDNPAPVVRKTDDELAMDALLGKTSTNKQLVIEAAEPMTETDAFRHDFVDAPDMATLDDYARVPVEDFGAAMLRGMGWKEGEGIGSQKGKKLPKEMDKLPERRANLLGIGAKEDAALAQEMGAWGKAAKGGKEVKIYNPVLLRDKRTGAMYTEEELQKKREKDERAKYEDEFDRKERERERRRRKDEQEDGDRDSRDRRRDRDDRKDRERDRRKHEDESDEEYYRRKERERRRRRERNEDDGDRSRRQKDHDHGHRDRDRRNGDGGRRR